MRKELNRLIYCTFLVTVSVLVFSFFWENNLLITSVIILISIVLLFIFREKDNLYVFITMAIIGPLVEICDIYFGAWQYSNPNLYLIPTWLPFVWGEFGIFGNALIKFLDSMKK